MSTFFPEDLDLKDTSSPLDILKSAKEDWSNHSNGMLDLIVQEAVSANKNDLLIIHARHVPSNRTITLFSVAQRPNAPYPARIQPKGDELPDLFKKTYYQPGIADMGSVFRAGGQITNEWVCDTPAEFRSKLKKVFNLGTLKSDVLSLVSGATLTGADQNVEPPNESSDGKPEDEES